MVLKLARCWRCNTFHTSRTWYWSTHSGTNCHLCNNLCIVVGTIHFHQCYRRLHCFRHRHFLWKEERSCQRSLGNKLLLLDYSEFNKFWILAQWKVSSRKESRKVNRCQSRSLTWFILDDAGCRRAASFGWVGIWVEPEFSSSIFITVRRITGFSRRILTLVWETQLGCSLFTLWIRC